MQEGARGVYRWYSLRFDLSHRFLYVWLRNMQVWRRFWISNLVTNFLEPFLYLLGMGMGLGRYVNGIEIAGQTIPYAAFIAPGIIASSAMFNASFECTFGTFVRMVFQRTFDAIISTPVSVDEVSVGEGLYGATKSMIFGTVILLVIHIAGWVPGFHLSELLVPFAALLVGLVFASLGLLMASLVPSIESFNYYVTLFLTPMFIFSGIFFPLAGLPAWAQQVAWFTPLYHAVSLLRGLVLGGTGLWADALWLLALFVLIAPWPLLLMRRKLIK